MFGVTVKDANGSANTKLGVTVCAGASVTIKFGVTDNGVDLTAKSGVTVNCDTGPNTKLGVIVNGANGLANTKLGVTVCCFGSVTIILGVTVN